MYLISEEKRYSILIARRNVENFVKNFVALYILKGHSSIQHQYHAGFVNALLLNHCIVY